MKLTCILRGSLWRKMTLLLIALSSLLAAGWAPPAAKPRNSYLRAINIHDFTKAAFPGRVVLTQYVVEGWDDPLFDADGRPFGTFIGALLPSEDGQPVQARMPLSGLGSPKSQMYVWRPFLWTEQRGWWPVFSEPPYGLVAFFSHEDVGVYDLWLDDPLAQSFDAWGERFHPYQQQAAANPPPAPETPPVEQAAPAYVAAAPQPAGGQAAPAMPQPQPAYIAPGQAAPYPVAPYPAAMPGMAYPAVVPYYYVPVMPVYPYAMPAPGAPYPYAAPAPTTMPYYGQAMPNAPYAAPGQQTQLETVTRLPVRSQGFTILSSSVHRETVDDRTQFVVLVEIQKDTSSPASGYQIAVSLYETDKVVANKVIEYGPEFLTGAGDSNVGEIRFDAANTPPWMAYKVRVRGLLPK